MYNRTNFNSPDEFQVVEKFGTCSRQLLYDHMRRWGCNMQRCVKSLASIVRAMPRPSTQQYSGKSCLCMSYFCQRIVKNGFYICPMHSNYGLTRPHHHGVNTNSVEMKKPSLESWQLHHFLKFAAREQGRVVVHLVTDAKSKSLSLSLSLSLDH